MVGLALVAQGGPFCKKDFTEELPAYTTDKGLLVTGIEDGLCILEKCSQGEKYQEDKQYRSDVESDSRFVCQVLNDPGDTFRRHAIFYVQQL